MARPKLGETDTERMQLKITKAEIDAIDDWRFKNRIPSRSEAVRRLCQIGIVSSESSERMFADAINIHKLIDDDFGATDGKFFPPSMGKILAKHWKRIFELMIDVIKNREFIEVLTTHEENLPDRFTRAKTLRESLQLNWQLAREKDGK